MKMLKKMSGKNNYQLNRNNQNTYVVKLKLIENVGTKREFDCILNGTKKVLLKWFKPPISEQQIDVEDEILFKFGSQQTKYVINQVKIFDNYCVAFDEISFQKIYPWIDDRENAENFIKNNLGDELRDTEQYFKISEPEKSFPVVCYFFDTM